MVGSIQLVHNIINSWHFFSFDIAFASAWLYNCSAGDKFELLFTCCSQATEKIVHVEEKLSKGYGGENAYHVSGYRYLLVDRDRSISRASPPGKVATLAKVSTTSWYALHVHVHVVWVSLFHYMFQLSCLLLLRLRKVLRAGSWS